MTTRPTKQNKFPFGMRKFSLQGVSADSPTPSIFFELASLDARIGTEAVLVLKEDREFLNELKQRGPLKLQVNAGAANTTSGPILFMLWWFPPLTNKRPYASYELLFSPLKTEPLEIASRQTHIHLLIVDEFNQVFDVVEFENVYQLERLVEAASKIRPYLTRYDFARARSAFFQEVPEDSFF